MVVNYVCVLFVCLGRSISLFFVCALCLYMCDMDFFILIVCCLFIVVFMWCLVSNVQAF